MNTTDTQPGVNPCNPYAGKTFPVKMISRTFDIDKGDGSALVRLNAELKARGFQRHQVHSDLCQSQEWLDFVRQSREVTLECDHIFDDQWNTKEGNRLFDWLEIHYPAKLIFTVTYLDLPPEVLAVRDTLADGWSQTYFPADSGAKFNLCPEVLGGKFLREDELHLLRLLPVNAPQKRAPLTAEELAMVLPHYIGAQSTPGLGAMAKAKAKVLQEYDEAVKNAAIHRDGMLWLLGHGIPIDNAIYYKHTGRFCMGWYKPYGVETKAALEAKLAGFPFPIDIKTGSNA